MKRLILTALSALFLPASLVAQASSAPTRGFFAGLALHGTAIKIEDVSDSRESGGGATLKLGYGFTNLFSLYIEGSAASLDTGDDEDLVLSHFDLGARFSFNTASGALVPYAHVAVTGRAGRWDDVQFAGSGSSNELEISGAGLTLGGGLLIFFAPQWAFDANLAFTGGEFSSIRYGNVTVDGFEIDATSTRFNVGVSWHPGGRR